MIKKRIICKIRICYTKLKYRRESRRKRKVHTMGKDLKGKELGAGISQRKSDGLYSARYKGKTRYAQTLKEIKAIYRQLVLDIDNHTYIDRKNITLDDYFEECIKRWSTLRRLKGSTVGNYRRWYKAAIKETLGNLRVQSIDRRMIQNFHAQLAASKRPKTVNSYIVILKLIFRQAIEDGIIISDPARGIKAVRQERKTAVTNTKHRALTREEQRMLLQVTEADWLGNMVDLMLRTGLRQGEARALRWRDIDYKGNAIHVRQTAAIGADGRACVNTPKTETSERDIPLRADIKKVLDRQRKRNIEFFGNVMKLDALVFTDLQGRMLWVGAINRTLERAVSRIREQGYEIEPVTSHALRDTFATRAIEAGMTPQTLKTILGHASLAMTMDLYAHVLPDTKQEEMNRIAAAF